MKSATMKAPLKIHHLNCASMCPLGGKLVSGLPKMIVSHCLLVEGDSGLVLIDSGFSRADLERPLRRLGITALTLGLSRDASLTAHRQIQALGFSPKDVRHIIPTHLDLDHAGGIVDFPEAVIHVFREEHRAATNPRGLMQRSRYRRCHFAHGPRFAIYDEAHGERWRGFEAVREIPGLPPEILLIPLPGHTRGHTGIAIKAHDQWIFHVGDAYYDRSEIAHPREVSWQLSLLQRSVHGDLELARRQHERLQTVASDHPDVTMFCAHDPVEYERTRQNS